MADNLCLNIKINEEIIQWFLSDHTRTDHIICLASSLKTGKNLKEWIIQLSVVVAERFRRPVKFRSPTKIYWDHPTEDDNMDNIEHKFSDVRYISFA